MTPSSYDRPAGDEEKIAFIDFEASGLGARSWPVEIGWAFAEGEPASFLLKPSNDWPDSAWDPAAEKLHGLSREFLHEQGEDPEAVCERANEALAGCSVYSDAPDWDGFWLFRLFSVAGRKPAFSLLDYGDLMRPIVGDNEESLFARADAAAPRRHRAADDARHLQTLYRLALEDFNARK